MRKSLYTALPWLLHQLYLRRKRDEFMNLISMGLTY